MSIPQSGGGPVEHRAELVDYLEAGGKPPEDWRIGTEHEKFGYALGDHLPLPYDGPCSIHAMLAGLRDRFGWKSVEEAGKLIGLQQGRRQRQPRARRPARALRRDPAHHPRDLRRGERAFARGARRSPTRSAPASSASAPRRTGPPTQMPVMPKGRYALMTRYMGQVGSHGTQMMYRTCTVQVNLDFASEADMVAKFRVAGAAAGRHRALRLLAVLRGQVERLAVLARAHLARHRSRPHRHAALRLRGRHGLRGYVDYALDVPMYFVYRDGALHRRARPVLPRLPRRPAAGASRREADALATGRIT